MMFKRLFLRVGKHSWAWLRAQDLMVLLALLAAVLGVWAFIALAGEVLEGETQNLDQRILLAMRNPADLSDPVGPPWLEEMGRDLTAAGGLAALALITLTVSGFLALRRQHRAALLMIVAVGGGLALSTLLKSGFNRPRPSLVPHYSIVMTSSFPSGHSMLAAVVYLTLGFMLARLVEPRGLKLYVLGVGLLLTFLVGVSRVYLGVHYPTDVLAGWAAGLSWAVMCWFLTLYLQRRGTLKNASQAKSDSLAPR